jgi:hypothetical protein
MAVRGDEVAGSIDARVRESVEKMVAEIRSSIEDVRTAVDQQLKAALQSVQADVNAVNFLPQIRQALGELEQELTAEKAASPRAGMSHVKNAIQAIERGKSQVDILNALLEQCVTFGSRAALLILRGDTFSGWKGVGFAAHGGNDESVKRFNAAPGSIPELDTLLREEHVVLLEGEAITAQIGAAAASRAALVPMVIKDKVAAAVYVDEIEGGDQTFDLEAIELLVFTTGLLVDTLSIRKKIPSPSLIETAARDSAAPAAPATVQPSPQPPQTPPPPPPAPSPQPRESQQQIPLTTDPGRTAGGAPAATRPTFEMPASGEFAAPAPAPSRPAPPRTDPGSTSHPVADDRPSTQYIPPPGLARSTPLGAQTDEAKKHDEARRFARLLVSEIKLYNEAKVDQGRKNNDLYERLKEDIDRSRQMYDERISDDVRKVSNYFYDELVRILADGKPETLGL